jgi:hypothetical protein
MTLRVDPLSSKQDWKDFLELPFEVYGDDGCWVPSLIREERHRLDPNHHPFYRHVQSERFLVRRNGRAIGRLMVAIDSIGGGRRGEGTFGFFEALDDTEAVAVLFAEAASWFRHRSVKRATGPFDPSVNYRCGIKVDGPHELPTFWMPHAPRYYAKLLAETGLRPAQDLIAFRWSTSWEIPPAACNAAARALRSGELKIRNATLRRLREDIASVHALYRAAWSENWGAAPMAEDEFAHLVAQMWPIVRLRHVWIAERGGVPVGMLVSIPDLNPVLHRLKGRLFTWRALSAAIEAWRPQRYRLVLGGVLERERRRGTTIALVVSAAERLRRYTKEVEVSWTLEENAAVNSTIESFGARLHSRYRLYELDCLQ